MLSVCRSLYFGSHRWGSQCLDFLLHALLHAFEHRWAASHHDVSEEFFLDVGVALHDWVEGVVVDTFSVSSVFFRLEQLLRTHKPLLAVAPYELLSWWQGVDLRLGVVTGHLQLGIVVKSDFTEQALEIFSHDPEVSFRTTWLLLFPYQIKHVPSKSGAAYGYRSDRMRNCVTFEDWHRVSHSLSRV